MTFQDLLIHLGMETHLDLSEANKTGACTIQFDGDLDLSLEHDEDTGNLIMLVEIMRVPQENRAAFFSALMQLHLFGVATDGGVFGHDAQQDNILFFKTIALGYMNPEAALQQIENFVNQAQRWRTGLPESAVMHTKIESTTTASHIQN